MSTLTVTPGKTLTVTEKPKTVKGWIESDDFKGQIARSLPKHITPDRFLRVALTATNKTPAILKCTPESVLGCLLQCSQFGLEPDGRRAHLIPYGTACTLIIDYKGLAELAMRSGLVASLHADVVCENDEFEYDRGRLIKHRINFREPRGKVYAVYALATLKDGAEKCEVMTLEEVDAIRQRSRSGNSGPWKTDFNEMAKKTVFRRLSKWLPLSPEFRDAAEADEEQIDIEGAIDITPTADPATAKKGDKTRVALPKAKEQAPAPAPTEELVTRTHSDVIAEMLENTPHTIDDLLSLCMNTPPLKANAEKWTSLIDINDPDAVFIINNLDVSKPTLTWKE